MSAGTIDRRSLLAGAAAGVASTAALGGCDRITHTDAGRASLQAGEDANLFVQRLLLSKQALAREYAKADISPVFKPNGNSDPQDETYRAMAANGFADYRLTIRGLVERPAELSLADLRAMPSRTQITRHDCVEGWSCIGEWTGVPMADLLGRAGLKPAARYVVLRCADTMGGGLQPVPYYESMDLVDAFHPQTILAYGMNGEPLPVAHGAPLRLRLERQLGYKMAKYVIALDVVDSFADIGGGRGGFWEDRGYDWYAGI